MYPVEQLSLPAMQNSLFIFCLFIEYPNFLTELLFRQFIYYDFTLGESDWFSGGKCVRRKATITRYREIGESKMLQEYSPPTLFVSLAAEGMDG